MGFFHWLFSKSPIEVIPLSDIGITEEFEYTDDELKEVIRKHLKSGYFKDTMSFRRFLYPTLNHPSIRRFVENEIRKQHPNDRRFWNLTRNKFLDDKE